MEGKDQTKCFRWEKSLSWWHEMVFFFSLLLSFILRSPMEAHSQESGQGFLERWGPPMIWKLSEALYQCRWWEEFGMGPLNPAGRVMVLWFLRDQTSRFNVMKRLVVISWWPFVLNMLSLCLTLYFCLTNCQFAALNQVHRVDYKMGLSSAGLGACSQSFIILVFFTGVLETAQWSELQVLSGLYF